MTARHICIFPCIHPLRLVSPRVSTFGLHYSRLAAPNVALERVLLDKLPPGAVTDYVAAASAGYAPAEPSAEAKESEDPFPPPPPPVQQQRSAYSGAGERW